MGKIWFTVVLQLLLHFSHEILFDVQQKSLIPSITEIISNINEANERCFCKSSLTNMANLM